MGKLIIENGTWDGTQNENNTRHRGEGCACDNYSPELLALIWALIEEFLLKKYGCFKDQLGNETSRKTPPVDTNGPNDGPATIGSGIGPGVIGDNPNGDLPGYAGKSSIFVGNPDPEAVELAEKIEALKAEEEAEYIKRVVDNNC